MPPVLFCALALTLSAPVAVGAADLLDDLAHWVRSETQNIDLYGVGNDADPVYGVGDDTTPIAPIYTVGDDTTPVLLRPAQHFEAETDTVQVTVDADEGAFPAGTELRVAPVEPEDVMDQVSGAVSGEISDVLAVDISFYHADVEIEPALPVRVSIRSTAIAEMDAPVLLHLDDAGEAEVVDQLPGESLVGEPSGEEIVFDAGGL